MKKMSFKWAASHCAGCSKKVAPVNYPDGGVALGPLCDGCRAKQRDWLESHCSFCQKEQPRAPLPNDDAEWFCEDCAAYWSMHPLTDGDVPV